MPIDVPKVPYRLPGQPYEDWISIYNRLFLERILFLDWEINDETANAIVSYMLYLDSEDQSKDIMLYINSPGGSVTAGMAIYDTMTHIRSDVVTICVGLAASMGAFLLAAGTKGKRTALPHSRIMIHQPALSRGMYGQATDISIAAKQILRTRQQMDEILATCTGQTVETIKQDTDRDYYMSADEAKEYGLIDRVITDPAS
ncbi:MAG: ATP-dependent Clp protease proteolytic subunit [Spirulinaceae cyanobacterium RM2_2_10]|nr:ATP-dependent Clp protease proteolytic subunit [Spirulinaceae cyanobacterium SM2_1_0]NJO21088.1 ATP-dependent Clp protease proteolytic subunit [Spirulinaceae cyanobacterium RM2_2_10]